MVRTKKQQREIDAVAKTEKKVKIANIRFKRKENKQRKERNVLWKIIFQEFKKVYILRNKRLNQGKANIRIIG